MKVVLLPVPVGPALIQAAANLVGGPDTAVEWRLPDGDHAVDTLVLDLADKTVRLRGSDACTLRFAVGGLSLTAAAVEIDELTIDTANGTAALHVVAPRIMIRDLDAAATGAGAVTAVDLVAGETGHVDVQDLVVSRAHGDQAIGLRALGGDVRAVGVVVRQVAGATATGVSIGAHGEADAVQIDVQDVHAGTGAATGAVVSARDRAEVARIQVSVLTGDDVVGVAVLGFGVAGTTLSAVDLSAARLTGTSRATGLLVAARRLSLRGFSAMDVEGAAAAGAIVVGGASGGADGEADVEVGFGRVERVVAAAGDAAGIRVLAMPSPRPVTVRDVSVREIAGSPVPAGSVPPRDANGEPAWQGWAVQLLDVLSNEATPRTQPPALLSAPDVVGLAVTAMVDDIQAFLDVGAAGDVAVIDSSVRTVSGSAIQLETGLRPAWLRRTEVSTALRAGFVQADQLVIANTTWDRLGAPLSIGPGEVRAYDSIFSRVAATAEPIALDPDADWIEAKALFADTSSQRFDALGALPYVEAGAAAIPAPLAAGQLPPPEQVDLHLSPGSTLHRSAVPPPADDLAFSADTRLFVGAHPPDVPALCDLYDPLRRSTGAAVGAVPPSPVVDYRARDAPSLLAVMLDRARQAMPPWTDRGPADFTTMMLEAVAERFDHLAYQQERAVAEGFLDDARLRRSVEDHVRPLDYDVDPGLSATAMLRFRLDLGTPGADAPTGIAGVIADRTHEAGADTTDAVRKAWLNSTIPALNALARDGALEEIPRRYVGRQPRQRRPGDRVRHGGAARPFPRSRRHPPGRGRSRRRHHRQAGRGADGFGRRALAGDLARPWAWRARGARDDDRARHGRGGGRLGSRAGRCPGR